MKHLWDVREGDDGATSGFLIKELAVSNDFRGVRCAACLLLYINVSIMMCKLYILSISV